MGCSVTSKIIEKIENKPESTEHKSENREKSISTSKSSPYQIYTAKKSVNSTKNLPYSNQNQIDVFIKENYKNNELLNLYNEKITNKAIPNLYIQQILKPKIVFLDVNKYIKIIEKIDVKRKISIKL